MIFSLYCAVSATYLMFINKKYFARWNGNWCYSLWTTYHICEASQIPFPTTSVIFTAAKLFHQVLWEGIRNKSWYPVTKLSSLWNVYIFWCLLKMKPSDQILESAQNELEIIKPPILIESFVSICYLLYTCSYGFHLSVTCIYLVE